MRRMNYEADNRQAARIILADPDRYAGSLLTWARLQASKEPGKMKHQTEHDYEIPSAPCCWVEGCHKSPIARAHTRTGHRVGHRWVLDPQQWACEDHMVSEHYWQLLLFPQET